jgi:formylglycine-generating enzyme required for sulfatase activity
MNRNLTTLLLAAMLLSACASAGVNAAPPAIQTGVDPQSWAQIPAGEFLAGPHAEAARIDEDFEMMITDVTNAQYADYLNQALAQGAVQIVPGPQGLEVVGYYPGDEFRGVKHELEIKAGDWLHVPLSDPGLRLAYNAADQKPFSAQPGYANHPMTLVTWFGAKAYCEFSGWRLPTSLEWEKAARGEDGRPYPWGQEIARGNANYYSSHDVFEKITGALGDTTPVGFYNGTTYDGYATLDSPSPYGLYDMAGNVWQWVADIQEGTHYRLLRGGSKADYAYNLRIWTTNSAGPDYASPSIGFRCARLKP